MTNKQPNKNVYLPRPHDLIKQTFKYVYNMPGAVINTKRLS